MVQGRARIGKSRVVIDLQRGETVWAYLLRMGGALTLIGEAKSSYQVTHALYALCQ